jgi:multicomponent Na+:H+ antiporter subunit D
MKNLLPWQEVAINLAAVGTAIATAKFIFLPHAKVTTGRKLTLSGWLGIIILDIFKNYNPVTACF